MENQASPPVTDPDIPPPSASVSPPIHNPEGQKSKPGKYIVFLICSLLLILMGITGVYAYRNYAQKNKKSSLFAPTAIPSVTVPSQNLDSTASWVTFTSHYKYQIKHPSEWEKKTEDWDEGLHYGLQKDDEVVFRFVRPNQKPHGGFPYGVLLSLKVPKENPENLSPEEWGKKYVYSLENDIKFERSNIQVSGTTSAKITYAFNGKNTQIYIPYEDKIYEIRFNTFTETEKEEADYEGVFDQILSTFKFTETVSDNSIDQLTKVALASTVGWQNMGVAGLSLKIPPDASISGIPCSFDFEGCFMVNNHIDTPYHNSRLSIYVKPYKGGSRREEANLTGSASNYTITEKLFGSNKALDLSFNCQIEECMSLREIVLVVGNKLVQLTDDRKVENPITNSIVASLSQ